MSPAPWDPPETPLVSSTRDQNAATVCTKREIIARLPFGVRGATFAIRCQSVNAIAQQDLIELCLFLGRARDWYWRDDAGAIRGRQSAVAVIRNLLRDLWLWPGIYWHHRRVISRLGRLEGLQPCSALGNVLLIRTDHWFNIVSGGSVGHLAGVIDAFRQLGHTTHVISSDHLTNVPRDEFMHVCFPRYVPGRNIPDGPELTYNDQLIAFAEGRWDKARPSCVYVRSGVGNYSAVALARRHSVPLVVEYNGSEIWVSQNWSGKKLLHHRLLQRIEDTTLQAADLIVVVSEPLRVELIERGIPRERILVNPNGVDPVRYSPAVDGATTRMQYGLRDHIVLGFIGTFGPWHGAEVLAEAVGLLLQRWPGLAEHVRLLLVGDGPRRPAVETILRRWGIYSSCVLTGRVRQDHGPTHLAACDILVSPHVPNPDGSAFFGSPTKLFEYMAMERAIVASDLEQLSEVLTHDETAYLVPPGDSLALAEALHVLIDDPDRRRRLAAAARAAVVARHTWRQHVARTIAAIRQQCEARAAVDE